VAGVLGLGPRWTGEVYGERDLQLIGILARQMTLSILNSRQLERLQAMSQLIAQAEENERRKIARELHDTILQFLLVLTYGLDDLKERQSALADEIERWQERISAEAGQLRSLLTYLRAPELLVQQGLVPSLESWLEQVQQETTMAVEADLAPEVEPLLSSEAKVAIYRVCREAVHNALKHSGGSRVAVKIWTDGESVRFSVEDDGQGFDVTTALVGNEKGYSSLQDLRICVESVGGQLEVHPTPNLGTVIKCCMPLTGTQARPG
jgi:signal transduction histidine kinase